MRFPEFRGSGLTEVSSHLGGDSALAQPCLPEQNQPALGRY